ncbi:tc5 transposase DNA-binding domain-containing protein [Ditylenchus destructor]|uniref:Tc5 transposase DNA-binding domain-containing protein n=1 Tax=Ditylenchus destructor TaxID=166010 RepID=A0AAD4MR07_9BILA|nr:tc5 transposase DNA-binding domain-containing protein [Ditylenchus destructor]
MCVFQNSGIIPTGVILNMNASSSDNQNNETIKTKRRSYSVELKLEVIEFAKALSHKEASAKFNVDPKSVRRWLSMENFLREMGKSPVLSKLTRIVGRDVQWAQIEDELYAWVQMRRENGLKIFLTEITAEVENILRRHPDCKETFKADSRYLSKFLSRHNIECENDTKNVINRGRKPVKERRVSESDSKSLREAAKIARRNIAGNVPNSRNVKLEFAPSSSSLLQSLESDMKEIDKKFQSPNATPRRPLRSKTIARVSVVKNVPIKKEFTHFEDFFFDDDDEVSNISSDDADYTPTGKARYELRSRPTEYEFRRTLRKRTTRSTAAPTVKQTPVKKPRAKSQIKASASSKNKKQTSQAKKATAKSRAVKQEPIYLDGPTTSHISAKFSPLGDTGADTALDHALNTTDTPITSRVQQKVPRVILSPAANDRDQPFGNPADEEDTQNAEIMHQELQSLLEVARATRSQNPGLGSSSSEADSIHDQDQTVEGKKIKVARILSLESQPGISHKPVTAGKTEEAHVKDSKLDVVDDDEKTQNDKIMQREWQSLLDPEAPTKSLKIYGLESSSSEIDQNDDHSRSVFFDEQVPSDTHVLPRESPPEPDEEPVAMSQDLEWSSSDDDLIDEENPRDHFVEKNTPNKTVTLVKYQSMRDLGIATKNHKQALTSSETAGIDDYDTGVITEERRIQKASPLERHSTFTLESDTKNQSQGPSVIKTLQTPDKNGAQETLPPKMKWKLDFEPVMTIQKPWSPKMMPRFGLEPVMSIQNCVYSSRENDPFDDKNVDEFDKKNTALISTKYEQVFDLQTAPETKDHGPLSLETTAIDDQDQTAIIEEEAVCNASSVGPQSTLNLERVTTYHEQESFPMETTPINKVQYRDVAIDVKDNEKPSAPVSQPLFDFESIVRERVQGPLSPEIAAIDDQDQTAFIEEEAVCNASSVEPQSTLNLEPVTTYQDQGPLSPEIAAIDDQDQTAIIEEEAVRNASSVEPESTLNLEPVTTYQDQGPLSLETTAIDDQDQTAIIEEEAVCNASSVGPQSTLNSERVTTYHEQESFPMETTPINKVQYRDVAIDVKDNEKPSAPVSQPLFDFESIVRERVQDARIRFSPTSNSSSSEEIDVINLFDDEEEVTSNGISLSDESKTKFDLKVAPTTHIHKPLAIRTATVEIDVVTVEDEEQTENGNAVSKEPHSVRNNSEYSVTGLHDTREDEVFVIIDDLTEGYPTAQNLDIKPIEQELHSSQNLAIPISNQNIQQGSYLAALLGEPDAGAVENYDMSGRVSERNQRSWSADTEPLYLYNSRSSLETSVATINQEPPQGFNTLNGNIKANKRQPEDNSECEYQTKAKNSRKRKQSGPSQSSNKPATKRGQSLCKIAKTKNDEQPHSHGEGEDRKKNNNARKRKPTAESERQKADIKRAKSCMPRQLPFF